MDSRSAQRVAGSSRSTCSSLAGSDDPLCCLGSLSLGTTSSRVLGTCDPLRDRGAEARSARKRRQASVFFDSFVSCMSPSQRVLHVSQVLAQRSSTQDMRDMHAVTNSCGSVHGVLHDNSSAHVNSLGALGHRNSCNLHAARVQVGTKSLSTSTRRGVRRSAVDESAHTQQTPLKLHGETWAGLLRNHCPQISQEVEIVSGCAVAVACPSCPDYSPEPPGPHVGLVNSGRNS